MPQQATKPSSFGGSSSHPAFSDFAHLQFGMQNFALSLGNDGSDVDEMKKLHDAKVKQILINQKKAAAAAAALITAKTNADGEKEGPCPRPDCTKLRDSDELEEKIFDERITIEDKIESQNQMLAQIQTRIEEGEMETKANAERTKQIQSQIKEKAKKVKALEELRDGMEDVQKEIMNQIMQLQIKSQKAKGNARQAQQNLVDAMWGGSGGDSSGTFVIGATLSPLQITKRGPPKEAHYTQKYTNLANDETLDITEFTPGEQRPRTTGSVALGGRNKSNNSNISSSRNNRGGNLQSLDGNVWGDLTANLPTDTTNTNSNNNSRGSALSRKQVRNARTASANPFSNSRPQHNPQTSRKLMLMMSGTKKKQVKKPKTAPSRSLKKISVLAELKEQLKREMEGVGVGVGGEDKPESEML